MMVGFIFFQNYFTYWQKYVASLRLLFVPQLKLPLQLYTPKWNPRKKNAFINTEWTHLSTIFAYQ